MEVVNESGKNKEKAQEKDRWKMRRWTRNTIDACCVCVCVFIYLFFLYNYEEYNCIYNMLQTTARERSDKGLNASG